jgi:hypothetical protein
MAGKTKAKRRLGVPVGYRLVGTGLIVGLATVSVAIIPAQVAQAATDTVTNCSGSPSVSGSLSYEVAHAGSGDFIQFALSPACSTITVSSTIDLTQDISVNGPGSGALAVSGGGAVPIFSVASGVSADFAALTITDGNSGDGGALDNDGNGLLSLTDSVVSNSSAASVGGGIYNNGTLLLTNSTVTGNSASLYGGAVYNSGSGIVSVTNSTVADNTAAQFGGAFLNDGSLTVANSTLSGNSTGQGGGGLEMPSSATTTVTNSTVANNSATFGAGLDNDAGTLSVAATIVADNGSGGDCGGTLTTDQGDNLSDDTTCAFHAGTDLADTPAGLDASGLQSNGGPTQTIALDPGSAAIDHVSNGALCPSTDQRGASRTTPCDIGAYDTDWGPAVEIDVSGSQTSGGSSNLSYTTTAPGGVVSGTLTCTTVDGGTPLSPGLAIGTHTVDGSNCSGLSSSDQADYAVFPSSYVGVTNGYAVSTITAVYFGGSVSSPVVTVVGSGFGSQANLGPAQGSCGTGSNYADNLYLSDTNQVWAAGQGPPDAGDCIGLIISSYSDTDIVFTFGSEYGVYPVGAGVAQLTGGDSYTMNVLRSTLSGTVSYHPLPVVSDVSPATGFTRAGDTAVTLTGSGFTGATAVDFGGIQGLIDSVTGDTSMSVTAPTVSSAGTVDVTVTAPGGQSSATPADEFTYTVDQTSPQTEPCTPTCVTNTATTSLNTTSVSVAGASGNNDLDATTNLTVNSDTLDCGSSKTKNYDYVTAVSTVSTTDFAAHQVLTVTETLGSEPSTKGVKVCYAPSSTATSGSFLAKCKPSKKAPCLETLAEQTGSVQATLLVPAGDPRFWAGDAALDLTSFSPTKGKPGTTVVTIKGKNLAQVRAVVIGGAQAAVSSQSTDTKLIVTVPAGAAVRSGVISVTSASGEAVSIKTFTVT